MGNDDTGDKIAKALEESKKPQDNTIVLSTGVVLRGKQAPPLLLIDVMGHYPRPKPPIWFDDKMGRSMENAADPDYLERVKAWETEQANALLNVLIATGTELVELPKGMEGPDGEDWVTIYSQFGLPVHPDNPSWRYLRWVMFKAAPETSDLSLIQKVVGRLSGIPESAVQTAEAFPGRNQENR